MVVFAVELIVVCLRKNLLRMAAQDDNRCWLLSEEDAVLVLAAAAVVVGPGDVSKRKLRKDRVPVRFRRVFACWSNSVIFNIY